jgi:hypothetical protein
MGPKGIYLNNRIINKQRRPTKERKVGVVVN